MEKITQDGFQLPNVGDYVETPRFLRCRISEVFDTHDEAFAAGFNEPTHYRGAFQVRGKFIGMNRMIFAAFPWDEGGHG